jgi:calcineurin-like phosphoesterase family protein
MRECPCEVCDLFGTTGNKAEVARLLGRPRSTVFHHLRRLGKVEARQQVPKIQPENPDFAALFRDFIEKHGIGGSSPVPVTPTTPAPAFQPKNRVRRPDGLVDHCNDPARVLVVGCVHAPFHSEAAVGAMLNFAEDFQPDLVLLIGDILDNHAISRHEKDDLTTWQEEIDESRPVLASLDAMPGRKVMLMGNHDERTERFGRSNPQAFKGLEALDFANVAGIPDSWDVYADQTHYRVGGEGGIVFLHGNIKGVNGRDAVSGMNVAAKMRVRLKDSCMFAHFHKFDHAQPMMRRGEPMWEAWGLGWMGDPKMANYVTLPEWQLGFASIHFNGPGGDHEVRTHRYSHGRFLIGGREYK